MDKYIIYIRVSSQRQAKQGISLEAQLDQCRSLIKSKGGENIGEFIDVKGGASKTRPEFIKALGLAMKEDATIVFWRLDRFAREEEYAHKIKNSGVKMYFMDKPDITPFIFGVLVAVAADERRALISRVNESYRYRRKLIKDRGGYYSKNGSVVTKFGGSDEHMKSIAESGGVASGLQKTIALLNDERRITALKVAQMLQAKGEKLSSIANILNENGMLTRTDGKWSKGSVSRLLNHPNNP
jgi:DNA invertase Pin-like site-specific DNA recombinase